MENKSENHNSDFYDNGDYIFLNVQKKRVYPRDEHSFNVMRNYFRNICTIDKDGAKTWQVPITNLQKKIPIGKYKRLTIGGKNILQIDKSISAVLPKEEEHKVRGSANFMYSCEMCGYKLRTYIALARHREKSGHRPVDLLKSGIYYPHSSLRFVFLVHMMTLEGGAEFLRKMFNDENYYKSLPEHIQEELKIVVRNLT